MRKILRIIIISAGTLVGVCGIILGYVYLEDVIGFVKTKTITKNI